MRLGAQWARGAGQCTHTLPSPQAPMSISHPNPAALAQLRSSSKASSCYRKAAPAGYVQPSHPR